jgi:predicted nucleic acid-binding protein
MGHSLLLEYEDVMGRADLFERSPLGQRDRRRLLEAFMSVCEWVQVYYLWRPNLRDEGDNHVLELAVAGAASMIVTNNVSDFLDSNLRFPEIRILKPAQVLKEWL